MTEATLFHYCERGQDASFWAEPLNAVSNAGFVLAGIGALYLIARRPRADGPPGMSPHAITAAGLWPEVALSSWLIVIGIGSFIFHTFANPTASIADVVPIVTFMLAYSAYATNRFFGWHPMLVIASLICFAVFLANTGELPCSPDLLPVTKAHGRPCLNGSLRYIPALVSIFILGFGLMFMRHPAATRILAAGAVFLVALAARTLDWEVCDSTRVFGAARGTHMIWHILNALMLYLLASASFLYGHRVQRAGAAIPMKS